MKKINLSSTGRSALKEHLPFLKLDKSKNVKSQLEKFSKKVEIHSTIPVKKVLDGEIVTLLYDRDKNEYVTNDKKELVFFDNEKLLTKETQTIKIEGFNSSSKELELSQKFEDMNKVLDKSAEWISKYEKAGTPEFLEQIEKLKKDFKSQAKTITKLQNQLNSEENSEDTKPEENSEDTKPEENSEDTKPEENSEDTKQGGK